MMFLGENFDMIDKSKILFKKEVNSEFFFDSTEMLETDVKIEYSWTRDTKLIKEYTKLIDERFREEINLVDTYKKINNSDFESYFLIGTVAGEVAGGVRVNMCAAGEDIKLPTEKFNFNYKSFFNELDLHSNGYCEMTRYAVRDKYRRDIRHYRIAFQMLRSLCREKHIKYLFLPASASRQKLYRVFASEHFKYLEKKDFDIADLDGQRSALDAKDFCFSVYEST